LTTFNPNDYIPAIDSMRTSVPQFFEGPLGS